MTGAHETWSLHRNKAVNTSDFSALMHAVGWGSDYPEEKVSRSIDAYSFVAHARSISGELLGYVSAFSDGAFTTMLGELVVHPDAQRSGIGRALLQAVQQEFPGIAVYVKPLGDAKLFFQACGFRRPTIEMQVLFHPNC
jgi:GNAT superfamily N-acetyltransferase